MRGSGSAVPSERKETRPSTVSDYAYEVGRPYPRSTDESFPGAYNGQYACVSLSSRPPGILVVVRQLRTVHFRRSGLPPGDSLLALAPGTGMVGLAGGGLTRLMVASF